MAFCPKCEEEFRDGFTFCQDCGVDLVATLVKPEEKRIEVEEQYAADMFRDPEEESVHFCPICLTQYVSRKGICTPCGNMPVENATPEHFEAVVGRGTLTPFARFESLEDRTAKDLVRVAVLPSPVEAAFLADSLRGMGLFPEIGDDQLDASIEETSHLGLYVAPDEVEAAKMLLPENDESAEENEKISEDVYSDLVRRADTYAQLGKYHHAAELAGYAIEMAPDRFEAFYSLGNLLGHRGFVEQAVEAFEGVIDRLGKFDNTPSRFFAAAYGFLDAEGGKEFKGKRADAAYARIREFCAARPRHVAALKLWMEAAVARGDMESARTALAAIEKVNRHLFEIAGEHVELARRIRG